MFGQNPISPPDNGNGSSLLIKSIFATFQGEGPYTGYPSVFVRLAGCNLACTFCDTEFDDGETIELVDIVQEIKKHWYEFSGNAEFPSLIVITGGEPFRQNIVPFCEMLIANKAKVQIETNGILYRPIPQAVEVVCSPKVHQAKYWSIHGSLWQHVIAIKLLVSESRHEYQNIDQALELYLVGANSQNNHMIYVQPIDEYDAAKNAANLQLAMRYSRIYNCILSIQLHKIIGVE